MKKSIFILSFLLINYLAVGQQVIDTTLSLQASYWKNYQCGQVLNQNNLLKIYGADHRIGANVHYDGFLNLQNDAEIYIKWKFEANGWAAFSIGPSVRTFSGLANNIPTGQWLYTHITIDSSNHSIHGNVSTNNYDDMGGTLQYQHDYTLNDNIWNALASTDLMFGFNDNYGGTSTEIDVEEVLLKHIIPVDFSNLVSGHILYHFEENQIPSNFQFTSLSSNWQVIDTVGINSTHSLYAEIPQYQESILYLDINNGVKVSFDIKYESETHKYMRFMVDTVQVSIHDAYQNTCWKHIDWQFANQGPHRLMWKVYGTNYDDLPGKIWLDNIKIETTDVQYTAIPDSNFENALSIYDDIPNDHQVPTAAIDTITVLNVENHQISDLSGIEDFISLNALKAGLNNLSTVNLATLSNLKNLWLESNQLSSIDLSNNINLEMLTLWHNQLNQLDISHNPLLNYLSVYDNNLTQIDLSNNTNLVYVYVQKNQLNSIDVSNLPYLFRFNIWDNQISQLDLTNNPNLRILDISNNPISSIDLSGNPHISWLYANETDLTNLDLTQYANIHKLSLRNCPDLNHLDLRNGNNSIITDFDVRGSGNLHCIFIDDANWWQQNFSNYIDNTQAFVENQTQCDTFLDVEQLTSQETSLFPNPVTDYIVLNKNFQKYVIYDILGKSVQTGKVKAYEKIDVSQIKSGIYLIKVYDKNSAAQSFKFIKI